jgi:predicted RNA-binding Zn ribbon-like protein
MDIDSIDMIAGHPALDFVNTVEGRGSEDVVNYLADFGLMLQWCRRAGLITVADGRRLVRGMAEHPIVAGRVWQRSMELREDLNAIFRAVARDGLPPERELAHLNAVMGEAYQRRQLLADKSGGVRWGWATEGSDLESPLWEIALAAANLLTDDDMRSRVKVCANGPCDWLFLDTSRSGRRRWCRMNVCGNAAKVRRFRERQRGA